MNQFLVPPPPIPHGFAQKLPLVKPASKPDIKSFQHAGDFGDLIYGLPVIKALGPGILYLTGKSSHPNKVRDPMTEAKVKSIGALLKIQPYIADVRYSEEPFIGIDYDLNNFRTLLTHSYEHWLALSRYHTRAFKLPDELDAVAWLKVDYAVKLKDKPVVVARSPRYHNAEFPWSEILKRYSDMMIFVGLPEEHQAFEKEVFKIPYHPTENFLDLARLIAGADLFIGNQSSPRAVAEGLKVPVLIEGCSLAPNTHFERPNAAYVYTNEKVTFPSVGKFQGRPRMVLRGQVESETAYGQLFRELCIGLARYGVDVSVNPTFINNQLTPAPVDVLSMIAGDLKPDLTLVSHNDIMRDGYLRGGEIVFTMSESTRLFPKVVDMINLNARAVVVPSMWNAGILDACGCNVPIRIVPLGIDPEIFAYTKPPGSKDVVSFCTVARHSHGKERKGLVMLGRIFQKAFPIEKDVALNYKVHPDCDFERVQDERVTYRSELIGWPDMAKFYRSNTAYISASKGEGWSLCLHQSMAVGCCPIAARFAGQSEFFDESVGRPVRFRQVRATGDYEGMGSWADLDEDSLITEMRWVYENRKAAQKLGKIASLRAASYPWNRTIFELLKVLQEFGVT